MLNSNDYKQDLIAYLNQYSLLYSKIAPHGNTPNSVPRLECLKFLESDNWSAATIIAPAGFGKSNLVRQYVTRENRAFSWLSIDVDENDIYRFAYYTIAAIKTIKTGFDHENYLTEMLSQSVAKFKVAFINELALLTTPLILVFDDFHRIVNPLVKDLVRYLIIHAAAQIKIIVISREPVNLNLARLRMERKIIDLGPDHLRFSQSETTFLFLKYGAMALGDGQLKTIQRRTEGWPAALQLVYMSAKDGANHGSHLPSFNNHYIKDYIREEILDGYSPELKNLLLKSSILASLTPELCQAITGVARAGEVLEGLQKSNTFIISLDKKGTWFRFHHIFGEALSDELFLHFDADERAALHKKASQWYEQNGYLQEAIDHAIRSTDYVFIDEFLDRNVEGRVLLGQLNQLVQWFGKLEEKKISSPVAKIWIAWLKVFSHDIDHRALDYLIRCGNDAHAQHGDLNEVYALIPAHVAGIRGFIATFDEQYPEAIRLSLDALDILHKTGVASGSLESTVIFNLARTWFQVSDFKKVIQYSEQSEALAFAVHNYYGAIAAINVRGQVSIQMLDIGGAQQLYADTLTFLKERNLAEQPFAGYIYCGLAEVEFYRDNLDAALTLLRKAVEISTRGREIKSLLKVHRLFVEIYQQQGNKRRLHFHLRKLDELATKISAKNCLREIRIFRESILLGEKLLPKEERIPAEVILSEAQEFTELNEFDALLQADKLMVCKRPEEALKIIEHYIKLAKTLNRSMSLLKLYFTHSRVLAQLDRRADSFDAMLFALRMSLSHDVELLFAKAKKWMPLKIPGHVRTPAGLAMLQAVNEQQNKADVAEGDLYKSALTKRELEIMEQIKQGLSNKQIADAMNISEGTVKRHLHNIFSKLNVKNRIAASRF